ncbi:hypothetical protein [Actinomycetospora termitidis]|uniref:Uncharacterized protein n=1 Tax=Actinomycetospora termitidis TaxID=3053470 RepID=A0ABT7MFG9_9PSEU|nr:hypothetical protein [Actinomycetospora sp. Odt1-22]MDL5159415.1 hypothetical protein [Actinomycetospora sp. Odt1-22]
MITSSTIQVPLIPKAEAALKAASARDGLGHADTMNRAVQLYDVLSEAQRDGRKVYVDQPGGGTRELLWDPPA